MNRGKSRWSNSSNTPRSRRTVTLSEITRHSRSCGELSIYGFLRTAADSTRRKPIDTRFQVPASTGISTSGSRWFLAPSILYLTDTPPEQGALTLVPGFHRRLEQWLKQLDERDPQQEDLHALGSKSVGASAGDMIIWHQLLPHGSRPNLGSRPRIVQYINMYPGRGTTHA